MTDVADRGVGVTEPVPRQEVYDAYWRFAAERNAIFMKRVAGEPPPWTDDLILQRFKFCNTFRAADRVSQYLIREVIYGDRAADLDAEDTFLRIFLFRLFSKESTWKAIEESTGGLTRATLDVDRLGDLLEEQRARQPVYTGDDGAQRAVDSIPRFEEALKAERAAKKRYAEVSR